MDYEIVKVDDSGAGYAVILYPNGDTFGQRFQVSDTSNEASFYDEVEQQLFEAEARQAPIPVRRVAPEILAALGQRRSSRRQVGRG